MSFIICVSVSIFIQAALVRAGITCRGENNQIVDWYAIYKLPKLERESPQSLLGRGEGYAVLNVGKSQAKWELSGKTISSSGSVLGNTLQQFYSNKNGVTYLMYNDDPEDDDFGTSAGHTKGVVVFDEQTGFWLIHSIPKFPPANGYVYPASGLPNGQSALCITFKTKELNEIGKQLLYNHPNIYAKGSQAGVINNLDANVKSLFSDNPKFIRKPPFSRVATLTSNGNQLFTSFAKDNQYNGDLYSAIIAPKLRSPLYVETWRRGSGTPMDPSCQIKYKVEDVLAVNITVFQQSKAKYVGFQYTEDHSKWAISSNPKAKAKWVCIGDINRMQSQGKRGGGSVCFTSSQAWRAYFSSVSSVNHC